MKKSNLEKLIEIKSSRVKLSRVEFQRLVQESQKEGLMIQNKPIAEEILTRILEH